MTTKLRNIKTDEDIHLTMSIYCRLKNIKMQDFANEIIREKLEKIGAKPMSFTFDMDGLQTWEVEKNGQ